MKKNAIIVFMNKRIRTASTVHTDSYYLDWESGTLLSPVETQNYQIIQVADIFSVNDTRIEPHTQYPDIELSYCCQNKISCATNNVWSAFHKNDAYLSFSDESHALKASGVHRFLVLAFNINKNSPYFPIFLKIKQKHTAPEHRVFQSLYLDSHISNILSALNTKSYDDCYALSDALITQILVALNRYDTNPAQKKDGYSSKDLLPEITAYIDSNYLTILSLTQISYRFGLSYHYLCKIFKEQYGYTVSHYVLSKKLNHAKMLLANGNSINEISEILNYTSPYNFSRAYKNHFGYPPSKEKL